MIIIVSNRNVNEGATNETLFGEQANAKGLDEIRLATAVYNPSTQDWELSLIAEPEDGLSEENRPSKQVFKGVMNDIRRGQRKKNWVFYIHGFNQSFLESLEACRDIQTTYDVDVITFSWPSNPGGFVTSEYQRARQAARASSNALDHTLEILGRYLASRSIEDMRNCPISLNFLIHSLGNFLVESFVRDPVFSRETQIFDNIIFHQADVNNRDHAQWINQIQHGRRIYITLNEADSVLKASDIINPGRLGNTLTNLNAERAIYLDFTNGENVRRAHNFFDSNLENSTIKSIFEFLLNGQRGETVSGLIREPGTNIYRL